VANIKQATKRAHQNTKLRTHNMSQRSELATALKAVNKALSANDAAKAKELHPRAVKLLDSAAGRGLVHKNKAARLKSRMNKKLKEAK